MTWLAVTAAVLVAVVIAHSVVRTVRLERLHEMARAAIPHDEPLRAILGRSLKSAQGEAVPASELAAYAGVTAAELVWHWATIDHRVIEAAAFSSTEPIHNGFDFAHYIHAHYDSLTEAGKQGFADRLMGYVGEQHVADLLADHSHAVTVADTSNQAVWDLLVDGHAANVKTVADIASIEADAAAHPHVIYYVPEDAHGHAAGNIVQLAGFKHDAAAEAVHDSIDSAHGILHHLPWVTIGFAVYRNYRAAQQGKDIGVAIHDTIAESIGRGTGVVVGAKTGAVIGTALGGPIGTFLGAIVGSITGGLLGNAVVNVYKQRPLMHALERLENALERFGATYANRIEEIRALARAPLQRMEDELRRIAETVDHRKHSWRWWLWPDFYTVLLEEAMAASGRYLKRAREDAQAVESVLNDAVTTHRYAKLGALMANFPMVRERLGCDAAALEAVHNAREEVLFQRKQLNPSFGTA